MPKAHLFISGVAGFLGSHLAEWALKQGHKVSGCDNFSIGKKENIPKDVIFYEYDLLDLEKNKDCLQNVDIVFHAAACPYDQFSFFSPYEVNKNTFTSTASLLSASIHHQVKRFIFCSSLARYGDNPSPLHEDMTPKPLTPYGVAKVAGEQLLQCLANYYNFEFVICVPHNIFGPRQIYNDPYRNAVAIIINKMLQNESPILYGDGQQKRSFSPVKDLLGVFDSLLFSKKVVGEIINIGPDETYISLNELTSLLNDIMGKSIQPIYTPARFQEVKEANCQADKARRLLDYTSSISLREALEEMVEWVQSQGPKKFSYHQKKEIETLKFPSVWKEKSF